MSFQGFFPTPYRRLDRQAWVFLGFMGLLNWSCLVVYWCSSQWELDQRIFGLSTDQRQRVWISLPDELVVTSLNGKVQQTYLWQDLGIDTPMVNLVFAPQQLWMRQIDGSVMRCAYPAVSNCIDVDRQWSAHGYATLALLPNQQVLLLDNDQGNLLIYENRGNRPQHTYRQYHQSHTNIATDPKQLVQQVGLFKANSSFMNVDQQQWVIANTGFYRLDAWPITNGVVDFDAKPKPLFNTEGQPYFIEKVGKSWLVLEAESSLTDGWLNQYREKDQQVREIPHGLRDPNSMIRVDYSVFISDMDKAQITRIDIDPVTGDFVNAPWVSPDLQSKFRQIDQRRAWFHYLSYGAVAMMALLLIGCMLWLKKQGYDLNQSI